MKGDASSGVLTNMLKDNRMSLGRASALHLAKPTTRMAVANKTEPERALGSNAGRSAFHSTQISETLRGRTQEDVRMFIVLESQLQRARQGMPPEHEGHHRQKTKSRCRSRFIIRCSKPEFPFLT
jgi:hypothetical protein